MDNLDKIGVLKEIAQLVDDVAGFVDSVYNDFDKREKGYLLDISGSLSQSFDILYDLCDELCEEGI